MALRDNPILKQLMQTGEERMSKFATAVLSNEKVMGAIQKTVSSALDAKGVLERNVQNVLSTMNVPTAADVHKLEGKIEDLEKVFESLTSRITELHATSKSESAPVAAAPAAPASVPPPAPGNGHESEQH